MLSESPNTHIHYIFHPESRETILGWFLNNAVLLEEKEAFIDALINFDDRCHHFFYQTYFLAAEAIALFPNCSQANSIIDQLLKWSYSFCRTSKSDWKTHPQALTIAARETLKRTAIFLCNQAAETLGLIALHNETAVSILVDLIQNSMSYQEEFYPPEAFFGWAAVDALGKIGVGNLTAIAKLSQMLSDAQNPFLRCHTPCLPVLHFGRD